jgi:hypothetical protein
MIARIAAQREAATYSAATAIVNTGQVQQALALQRAQLETARSELAGAVELARRVADDVLAQDGAVAAIAYQLNVEGLQSQDSVLEAAVRQIDGLTEATAGQVDTARTLLRSATRSLDEALREQLRLLIAVERLEYQRVVLEARARASRSETPGPEPAGP